MPLALHVVSPACVQSTHEPPFEPHSVGKLPATHVATGKVAGTGWQHPPLQPLTVPMQLVVHTWLALLQA
jgi:hypothetical protein